MTKEALEKVLADYGPFKRYRRQLRYREVCPECGRRSSIYWRPTKGNWKCQGCGKEFSSCQVPGLHAVVGKVVADLLEFL